MTLAEFQTALHRLYQGDTSEPGTSDEDYEVRTSLCEVGINIWNAEEGVLWRELWTTASGTTSDETITLPTDFRFPGGFLRLKLDGVNWTYIPIVDQPKSELNKNGTMNPQYAWVTGNKKDGFTLNTSFDPGTNIAYELPYYKNPTIPSAVSDVIEMSDPYFVVYFALSKLHETDGEGDRATLALATAESRLTSMKAFNSKAPSYQENYVPDRDLELGVGGFGE